MQENVERQSCSRLKVRSVLRNKDLEEDLLEDSNEQVEQQYVGKEQVNTKHDDGQPLREGGGLVLIQHRTLGLQIIGAVHAAGVDIKCSICTGQRD